MNIYCDNLKEFANVFDIYDHLRLHGWLMEGLLLKMITVMEILLYTTKLFLCTDPTHPFLYKVCIKVDILVILISVIIKYNA